MKKNLLIVIYISLSTCYFTQNENNRGYKVNIGDPIIEGVQVTAKVIEHLKGKKKKAAEKIAVVVEEVHLSSEGFNAEEAKKRIAEFAKLAEAFSAGL